VPRKTELGDLVILFVPLNQDLPGIFQPLFQYGEVKAVELPRRHWAGKERAASSCILMKKVEGNV